MTPSILIFGAGAIGRCLLGELEEIRTVLHDRFAILHQTVQIETDELAAEEELHI